MVVTTHQVKEIESNERKFIHSGFFPKIMQALDTAHTEQHYGPLKKIFSGIGDAVSNWFSPEVKAVQYSVGRHKRDFGDEHRDRDKRDTKCVFDPRVSDEQIDSAITMILEIFSDDN
jgi:hypothetical protein